MAKRLNYEVGFTANTQELQRSLSSAFQALQNVTKLNAGATLTDDLRNAALAAQELQQHLQNATNTNTGKLDLSRFQQSLKASNTSLEQYANTLSAIGPAGQEAFTAVASAIAKAEMPIARANGLLSELWTTMKNTMRWQLTSSALHGFMGAVSTAYGYTKDLNESLNRIQIVTNKSAEEMDRFAQKANDAAKALNTTTTKYTDASLIYYQQGLSDEEVEARTNVTIKLANVAGEAAETASEQLTAIWNNFYDGSKSLEYYADVMTALGASTASSTEEISTGIQKFAAIGNTVGLSYEYAAAALATVTATTRESADVVGTAFRTLFARIQGLLQDGEADDGTTLNKYSKALAEVGIQIKDTEGNLKSMDTLLNEMGTTWGTLTQAQKMALAQTVAGVRQYTQLMALMENWTFFQQNLTTAMGSTGTLQKQADIYAKSWQAARDNIRAAAEDIYDSLINDDFFIDFDKSISPVLSGIADAVDALGGMKGTIVLLGATFMDIFGNKISQGLKNTAYNLSVLMGQANKSQRELKQQAGALALDMVTNAMDIDKMGQARVQAEDIQMQLTINQYAKQLTDEQIKQLTNYKDMISQMKLMVAEQQDRMTAEQETTEELRAQTQELAKQGTTKDGRSKSVREFRTNLTNTGIYNYNIPDLELPLTKGRQSAEKLLESFEGLKTVEGKLQSLQKAFAGLGDEVEADSEVLKQLQRDFKAVTGIDISGSNVSQSLQQVKDVLKSVSSAAEETQGALTRINGLPVEQVEQFGESVRRTSEAEQNLANGTAIVTEEANKFKGAVVEAALTSREWSDIIVSMGSQLMHLSMTLQAVKNLGSIWDNEDLDTSEKMIQTITSVSMILSGLIPMMKAFTVTKEVEIAVDKTQIETIKKEYGARFIREKAIEGETAATEGQTVAVIANTKAWYANPVFWVVAGITAAIAAYAAYTDSIKRNTEAIREEAQAELEKAQAIAESTREQNATNKELIIQMQSLLETYQETNEGKDELDKTSRALAEALDIEGAAVARLSGRYEDYNKILLEALREQQSQLRKEYGDTTKELEAQQKRLMTDLGTGTWDFGGSYSGVGFNEEDVVDKALRKFFGDENVNTSSAGWIYDLDLTLPKDADEALEFYDKLLQVKNEVLDTKGMDADQRADAGLYQGLLELIKLMEPYVTQIRTLKQDLISLSASLGQLEGQTITAFDIKTLDDYQTFLSEITKQFTELGYSNSEIAEIVNDIVAKTPNSKVADLKEINDLVISIGEVSKVSQNKLEKIFTSDKYDRAILSTLNWGQLTDTTFQSAYDAAKRYQDALDGVAQAEEVRAQAEDLRKKIGSSEVLTDEEYKTAKDMAEQGLFDFTEFISMTAKEQKALLDDLIQASYQDSVDSLNAVITEAKAKIADNDAFLNDETLEGRLKTAYRIQAEYNKLVQAINDYQTDAENFNISDYNLDSSMLNAFGLYGQNLYDALAAGVDKLPQKITDMAKDAEILISDVQVAEEAKTAAQKDLDNAEYQIQVQIELEKDYNLERIRSSADDIVSVYEAIEKGVKKTTDEAGNSYWSFSLEATKAIEAIYPGFMAQANVMRDGTFSLTQDMYNAFFGMENGILAANSDSLASRLQNNITMLESERDTAKNRLSIYQAMAKGEMTLAEAKSQDEINLLSTYQTAQKIANGKMLSNQADKLDAERDNWGKLWEDVGFYTAEGAENMAENVADGTSSVLENLKLIRDAAYATGQQIAGIGTGLEKQEFSTDVVKWTSNNDNSIDTSSEEAFIQSVRDKIGGDTLGSTTKPNDGGIYMTYLGPDGETRYVPIQKPNQKPVVTKTSDELLGEAMAALEQQNITNLDEMIAANKEALSKLLGGINSTYEGVGSGGGGGDKEAKVEETLDKKTVEDIEDRYHEITRAIQDQDEAIQDLDDSIDRAYGAKRLELFKKRITELTKQADNYQARLKLAQHFLDDVDKPNLMEKLGLSEEDFGANGEILHYQDVLESIQGEYNEFIDAYNTFIDNYNSLNAEQQEALEKELEQWKQLKEITDENYEDKLDALDKYEESLDQIQEDLNNWEDTMREIEDQKLEDITYKMDVIIEVKNAQDAVRDFTKQIAESFSDALYNEIRGPKWTNGKGTAQLGYEQAKAEEGMLGEYMETYNRLQNLLANANQFTDVDAIKDEILDLQGEVIGSGEAILEWIETIQDLLPNALDAARERFEQFTNQLEHNKTMLDTIKELYALQGQTYKTEEGFSRLQRNAQEHLDAAAAQIDLNRRRTEYAKEALDVAQSSFEALLAEYGGDEIAAQGDVRYDTLKNNRDALLEEFNESQEALYQAAQEAMEIARDMYLEQVEKAVYDFGKQLSNGLGLDLLQDKYDHYIEKSERYLDQVNEAYEVASWYNKLQADIDKSTNPMYTERLKALQKEIDLRREGNTLSEYDLEVLEAKYKALQAQMALEDAQNNKNQLRLVRDRQGNWNYQYTANPDEIADKQQELLDAENEWYNIAKQQVQDVTGEIVSTWQECQDAIEEIYSDMTLTDQERADKAQEIYDYYCEKIKYLETEKQNALTDIAEAGNESLQNSAEATGAAIVGIAEEFDSTWADTLDSMTDNTNQFQSALDDALGDIRGYFQQYQDKVDEVAREAGADLDSLDMKTRILSDSTDLCRDAGLDMTDVLWGQVSAVQSLSMEYANLAVELMNVIGQMNALAAAMANTVASQSGIDNGFYDKNTDYSGLIEYGLKQGYIQYQDDVYNELFRQRENKITGENLEEDYYLQRGQDAQERFKGYAPGDEMSYWGGLEWDAKSYDDFLDYLKKLGVPGYATGGYTGEFDDAKLAFLHEKELVLNQEDSDNILSAVSAVRGISPLVFSAIESILDKNASAGIALMSDKLRGSNVQPTPSVVEQTVHIEASFPNATDRNEIEEAFNNLINDASQWANIRTQ